MSLPKSSIITPGLRWKIVTRLLKPEVVAEGKSRLGMEIRFLKILEKLGYDDPDFWLNLNLGFQLNSIIWLKNDGKTELKKAWGMYQLVKKQQKDLDEKKKEEIIAKMESIKNLAKPAASIPETKIEKKQTLLEWLDGDNSGTENWI